MGNTGLKITKRISNLSLYTTGYQQNNLKNTQNVLLIWLDNHSNDNNEECKNTINQLQYVTHTVHKFTDSEKCIEFITSIKDEKVCIIISGLLSKHVVPRVHNMSQVDSIFIFCFIYLNDKDV